jgi:hypothetical protein
MGDGSDRLRVTGTRRTMSTRNIGLTKVIHRVRDLASAKAVYAALLGVEPTMDESYYVIELPGSLSA